MEYDQKSLLRFVTTGSVDDGKSTLIGRLLYETKSVYEDQLEAVARTSQRKGLHEADLALLLDGLSAEREQGITIDVAYRYFQTATRKFIIADCPGHPQYTRNMVTGASTADCAIILLDARNGVLTQSKRHGFMVSLLQIPHMAVAVNKMDLAGYAEDVFSRIVGDYQDFAEKLEVHDITFIPVSALLGDNVVEKSGRMPWYEGPTLLQYLENIHAPADRNLIDFRFPVQYVLRPHLNYRGYAGRIVSGTISPGEEIVVLPSGATSRVKSIETYNGPLQEAFTPQSVVLTLEEEIDVSRGDMIVRRNNLPQMDSRIEAVICWLGEEPMRPGASYLLKQSTRTVKAFVTKIFYRIDVNTLHREPTDSFHLNDIGRIRIQTALPLFFDPYKINRGTGSFILIDPVNNHTVAAGMIRGEARSLEDMPDVSPHTAWDGWNIPLKEREVRNAHQACVLWFTGYSGSGKSTLARALERRLFEMGCQTTLLEGDHLRQGLCRDLGFSQLDRSENIRRAGEVAKLFFQSGHIVLCTFISPYASDRAFVRSLIPEDRFLEIYVRCDFEVCQQRDPNGLYLKALRGEIKKFTGISSTYEPPERPEFIANTDLNSAEEIVQQLMEELQPFLISVEADAVKAEPSSPIYRHPDLLEESSHSFITIVSGYPRSGTSLMMQMLEAGGLPVLRDEGYRPADERNPRGYYEIEAALLLGKEGQTTDWIAQACGKAVKVIAYQLRFLPPEFNYKVVFMRRRIEEVLASSGKFKLLREDSPLSEREKILAYKTEYVLYEAWLMKQAHLPAIFINYNDLLTDPAAPVARLCSFLDIPLDPERMVAAIEPALYRNRV